MPQRHGTGFGVYVHWPFCAAKCPYCDFNSHVQTHVDQDAWTMAFEAEIAYWANQLDQVPTVRSVFFGGGTPSLMEPSVVDRILTALHRAFPFTNDVEVTLEANPTSVETAKFTDFVSAGVNRFSVGVQALRDADLRALGRRHSADEARRAYDVARAACDRVSMDLIYARQHQSVADWEAELTEALTLGPTHLSLYQLTIEQGTAFGDRAARGRLTGLPDEDVSVELWEITQALTREAGLSRYEVSNHARDGYESQHNILYWTGASWLGIGPGAHGRFFSGRARTATVAERLPRRWLEHAGTAAATTQTSLQHTEIIEEYVLSALRLREGLSKSYLQEHAASNVLIGAETLIADGLLEMVGDRLRATERGTLVLNSVVSALLAGQST